MSVRILLTGKHGQVGFELWRALAPLGEIVAVGQTECNLADQDAIRSLVRQIRPGIIVNAAAYTAVDRAESEPDLAFAINSIAPGVLAEEAVKSKALVVHYCTDYVFDGTKQTFYREDDTPNPQNIYGKSKLSGVRAIQQYAENHLVFRTSWVFGAHGDNFVRKILKLATARESLDVVADQCGAPTSAALIADVTAQIVGQYLRQRQKDFPFGLYNLVAGGETTWCAFAQSVIQAAHGAGKPLKLKPENIRAITAAEYHLPASRPANSRLTTQKLQKTFGLRLPPWQEGLEHVLQQIL